MARNQEEPSCITSWPSHNCGDDNRLNHWLSALRTGVCQGHSLFPRFSQFSIVREQTWSPLLQCRYWPRALRVLLSLEVSSLSSLDSLSLFSSSTPSTHDSKCCNPSIYVHVFICWVFFFNDLRPLADTHIMQQMTFMSGFRAKGIYE